MSLQSSQNIALDLFPTQARSSSSQNSRARANSTGGSYDSAGRSFASRLSDSRVNDRAEKRASRTEHTSSKASKRQEIRNSGDGATRATAKSETITNSLIAKNASEKVNESDALSVNLAQSQFTTQMIEMPVADQITVDRITADQITIATSEEALRPETKSVVLYTNSVSKDPAFFGSAEFAESQAKGAATVSQLFGISSASMDSDEVVRAEAKMVELLINTKGTSSEQITKEPLFSVTGDGGASRVSAGNHNFANSTLSASASSVGSLDSSNQTYLSELLQRFDAGEAKIIRSASVLESGFANSAKSAVADLAAMTLSPNVRRALVAHEQTKQSKVVGNGKSQAEAGSIISAEQKVTGITENTSPGLNKGLYSFGEQNIDQNTFASMALQGSVDQNAAQLEAFNAVVIEGARGNGELASEIIQRGTESSPVRASFTLPERFGQTLRSGVKSITLQITPKHLGSAQLSVTVINDRVSGTLFVESFAAKAAAEVSLEQLANRLAEEGLSLDKLDVEVSDRNREEFGAEKRSDSERDESDKGHISKNMTEKTANEKRQVDRRSIVTASRIDALV